VLFLATQSFPAEKSIANATVSFAAIPPDKLFATVNPFAKFPPLYIPMPYAPAPRYVAVDAPLLINPRRHVFWRPQSVLYSM
jgi:hypothetical protein